MKPPLTLLATLLLSGCATKPGGSPVFQRDLTSMPYVLVVGDERVTSWLTPDVLTANPLWTPAGSALGTMETSGSVAARLPALLAAKHYDAVVIAADNGMFDLSDDPTWDFPPACGVDSVPAQFQTCTNINNMVTLAHQSGAKVILSLGPSVQDGSAGTPLIHAAGRLLPLNVEEYFFYRGWTIGFVPNSGEVNEPDWVIQMYAVVGQTDTGGPNDPGAAQAAPWTDDGVLFNPTGAGLATTALQAALPELHLPPSPR